jgi:hypothetical protein
MRWRRRVRFMSAALPFVLMLIALWLALLAFGCSAPPPHTHPPAPTTTPPPSAPPFAIEIGAPGPDSVPLALTDGQDMTLVAGAQGGFHVWLAYRFKNAPQTELTLERDATRVSDGTVVLRFRGDALVDATGDGWLAPAGPVPMFMCPPPLGVTVVGERIEYQLAVSDLEGNQLGAASVTLVPRCPPDDATCPRICAPN